MNDAECANCLVHGWKQPQDSTLLLKCKSCQVIFYCSKECQTEHWLKVHKRHCKYFADPSKNEPWQHKEQCCFMCMQVTVVGESQLKQVDNPNYQCIFKDQLPQDLVHPHPFPVTGQPGDIVEKGIIVLQQLVRKFRLIHPDVTLSCHNEFMRAEGALIYERIAIWRDRKTYPHTEALFHELNSWEIIELKLSEIDCKMENVEDPFGLWETIMLIKGMVYEVELSIELKSLKDPLANLPDGIKNIVSEGMDNSTEYLDIATKVIEALTTQVIPYEDVLKIVGGGSLEQECSFCSKEIDINSDEVIFSFTPLHLGTYFCGSENCIEKEMAATDDQERFIATVNLMMVERKANVCDFCFQMTPVKPKGSDKPDIHRCRYCHTMMYCSQDCLCQDNEIHLKVCQKDTEGRKRKPGGSARRNVARKELEMQEMEGSSDIFCEVLEKFKLKNARKEQKFKK